MFSYRGSCEPDEICFDQYRGRESSLPLRALYASDPPFALLAPPPTEPIRLELNLGTNEYLGQLQPWLSATAAEHLAVVITQYDDPRALFTLDLLELNVVSHHGVPVSKGKAKCEHCNRLDVKFGRSSDLSVGVKLRMPNNALDILAIHGLFST